MKKLYFILCLLFCSGLAYAQETVNLAFYNVLNYPSAPPFDRDEILGNILEEIAPDIFMICELESATGGQEILNTSLNAINDVYNVVQYQNNTSSTADLQQLLYYNRNKFELDLTDIIQTTIRDINRYRLKFKTQDAESNPKYIEVFITHLKSSQGGQNEQLRLSMVEEFTDYLDTLDPTSSVIFAGDLNLYSSDEPAYQELLDTSNAIVFKDPIDAPGDWNNNSDFEYLHTQSTRLSNAEFGNFGAGGGLDSRFDFIMLSENMFDPSSDTRYIEDSYAAFGNNSNCYNDRLDSADCDGFYGPEMRDWLYQMSDHLPVIAQLEIDEQFLSTFEVLHEPLAWFVRGNVVTANVVEIAFAKTKQLPKTVTLYDQLGRILQILPIKQNNLNIPVQSLANGVYYLKMNDRNTPPLKFLKTS